MTNPLVQFIIFFDVIIKLIDVRSNTGPAYSVVSIFIVRRILSAITPFFLQNTGYGFLHKLVKVGVTFKPGVRYVSVETACQSVWFTLAVPTICMIHHHCPDCMIHDTSLQTFKFEDVPPMKTFKDTKAYIMNDIGECGNITQLDILLKITSMYVDFFKTVRPVQWYFTAMLYTTMTIKHSHKN